MTRDGVTLLELLVVLTVLGLILGATGLAIGSLKISRESQEQIDIRTARALAIHTGAPRTVRGARFLPDGRVIGAPADPLTGLPHAR